MLQLNRIGRPFHTPELIVLSCLRSQLCKRIVQLTLGGLLLGAAGLKLYGHSVSALPSVGLFAAPSVQFTAILWELGLGVALIVGVGRSVLWFLSFGTFAVFAGISGYLGWQGVADCGCFGSLHVNPWVSFGIDVACLLILIVFRPDRCYKTLDFSSLYPVVVCIAISILIVGLISPAEVLRLAGMTQGDIRLSQAVYNIGQVEPNTEKLIQIEVENHSNRDTKLLGANLSCSCMSVDDFPMMVPAGRNLVVRMMVTFKNTEGTFSHEFHFTTDLYDYRKVSGVIVGTVNFTAP